MPEMNDYTKYKQQSIATMTKGELLVLLYEEVIKCLTKAKIYGYNGKHEDFEGEIVRAREIIRYFEQSLDFQYPISGSLLKVYDFAGYELSRALASRKTDILEELIPLFAELRDTWKEADRLSRTK